MLVTASVGMALAVDASPDELLRDADLALYEAKRTGRNRWVSFEPATHSAARDRRALEIDLREAPSRDQLFLLYQPLVDLSSEEVIGVEALIRWCHPERGTIQPDVFIGIAEDTGAGESMVLIHAMVALGRSLGLETVGEGIEQPSQLRHLQAQRCDSGQGYLFAPPLEAAAIDDLLRPPAPVTPDPARRDWPLATPRTTAAPRLLPEGSTTR